MGTTPLKRVLAYAIDLVLIAAPVAFLHGYVRTRVLDRLPFQLPGMLLWGLQVAAPVLLLGVTTGLLGWTPGKLILSLRVRDRAGDPPGLVQGILRELVKAVALGFFFGMLYAMQAIVTGSRTFYDGWLDLDVDDVRPYGLTETQKNWRKYQREQARKNAR